MIKRYELLPGQLMSRLPPALYIPLALYTHQPYGWMRTYFRKPLIVICSDRYCGLLHATVYLAS